MKREKTKEILVKTAKQLFDRFGYHKTSMDDIVRASKKSKGTLYYHFNSKEELFREVVNIEKDIVQIELKKILKEEGLSASEKLLMYLTERMKLVNGTTNYLETLKADFFDQNNFIEDIREDYDKWEKGKLKLLIVDGIRKKEFEEQIDVEEFIDLVLVVLKGFEIPFYVQDNYKNLAPKFKRLIQIIIRGISTH